VTAIEGTLVGLTSDTLSLAVSKTFPAEWRSWKQSVVVPQSAEMRIKQYQLSRDRTNALVFGTGLVLVMALFRYGYILIPLGSGGDI
jgi:hypothetical protein